MTSARQPRISENCRFFLELDRFLLSLKGWKTEALEPRR
jgi:hypothetical protein